MVGKCLCIGCENEVEMLELLGTWKRRPCAECCARSQAEGRAREIAKRNRELSAQWERRCDHEFKDFDPSHPDIDGQVLAEVLSWRPDAEGHGYGLGLVSAGSGLAKTRMMWALIRDLHFAGIGWRAITAHDLARLYGTNFAEREEAEAETERLCRTPVLFIDDLGKERKDVDAIAERVFHVIDRRYKEKLPLLWTSNLPGDRLKKQLGERGPQIVGRLGRMTTILVVVKGRATTTAKQIGRQRKAA